MSLLESMQNIQRILTKGLKFSESFIIRSHEHGDMGWVTHRHGILYYQEYGWNQDFEALVSQIVSDFLKNYNPNRERCWIVEMANEIVGSVFLVKESETIAKLRLLLVEPKARGLGIGSRLVNECIRFAKKCGYLKLVLWTNNVLLDARKIYENNGFKLVKQEEHHSFGRNLIGENWELML
jgi:GNAT superfamily N-acetyltransferase